MAATVSAARSRSKACKNCASKKRRCDMLYPTCSRCNQRGQKCEYDTSTSNPLALYMSRINNVSKHPNDTNNLPQLKAQQAQQAQQAYQELNNGTLPSEPIQNTPNSFPGLRGSSQFPEFNVNFDSRGRVANISYPSERDLSLADLFPESSANGSTGSTNTPSNTSMTSASNNVNGNSLSGGEDESIANGSIPTTDSSTAGSSVLLQDSTPNGGSTGTSVGDSSFSPGELIDANVENIGHSSLVTKDSAFAFKHFILLSPGFNIQCGEMVNGETKSEFSIWILLERLRQYPRMFLREASTIFIHSKLYAATSLPEPLVMAMCACALFENLTVNNEAAVREYLLRTLEMSFEYALSPNIRDKLAACQAIIIVQILLLYSGNIRLSALGEKYSLKLTKLVDDLAEYVVTIPLSEFERPRNWNQFIFQESLCRTVLIGFFANNMHKIMRSEPRWELVIDVPMTLSKAAWLARSESEWTRAMQIDGHLASSLNKFRQALLTIRDRTVLPFEGLILGTVFYGREWVEETFSLDMAEDPEFKPYYKPTYA
uniref:ARAD1C02376p n=1 Tax=Blastobotrys adeninivorans TaxID=409370 RepID=A0A060T516_BLAAD